MPPRGCSLSLQQKLRQQGVAGASSGRDDVVFREFVVEGIIWSLDVVEGNVGGCGGWNVGEGGFEGSGRGGERFGEDQGAGDGFVRGVLLIRAVRFNWNSVLVLMRTKEEADSWCSFLVDWIRNWSSSAACSSGISCSGSAKVILDADHENTTDLIMERYVTDPCSSGNDVTVSCSAILKYANAGRERQRTAMQKEAFVDAASLQNFFRRSFILMLIIESRVGEDRLYDPKIYSATMKEQVFDAQSLRLVEDYSATSSQPEVLQHWQTLFASRPQRYIISVLHGIITHSLEIDLDVVALRSAPVDLLFFLFVGERGLFIQFMDLPRKLLLQVVALLVKVPQFEVVLAKIWLYNFGNPTHILGGAQARAK